MEKIFVREETKFCRIGMSINVNVTSIYEQLLSQFLFVKKLQTQRKAIQYNFVRKSCSYNVGEINTMLCKSQS